jgi:flagellar hook assembly protein FlgD
LVDVSINSFDKSIPNIRSVGTVTMKVFDMLGRELVTLIDKNQAAGYHQIIWDSKDRRGASVSTGGYIVRIAVGEFVVARKIILLL